MTKLFDPADVQRFTGVTPESLRDWRRRRLLDDVGELQANGRWAYKSGDVLMFATVRLLLSRRLCSDLADAFAIASTINFEVYNELVPNEARGKLLTTIHERQTRIAVAFLVDERLQIDRYYSLQNIVLPAVPGAIVIDIVQLAQAMPPSIAELIAETL